MAEKSNQLRAAVVIGQGAFRGAIEAGAAEPLAQWISRAYTWDYTQRLHADPNALINTDDLAAMGESLGKAAVADPSIVPRPRVIDLRPAIDLRAEPVEVRQACRRAKKYRAQRYENLSVVDRAVVEGLEGGGTSTLTVVLLVADLAGDDRDAVVEFLLSNDEDDGFEE